MLEYRQVPWNDIDIHNCIVNRGILTSFIIERYMTTLLKNSIAGAAIMLPAVLSAQTSQKPAQAENPVHVISRKVLNL